VVLGGLSLHARQVHQVDLAQHQLTFRLLEGSLSIRVFTLYRLELPGLDVKGENRMTPV
jgi:hypothetical protein